MLDIINNLMPFFEDCYRRIGVREYAKIRGVSPPTASKILHNCAKENLLIKHKDRNNLFFHANKDSPEFLLLSKIYWSCRLNGLTDFLQKNIISPVVVLFGSLSKAEVSPNSDIDISIFSNSIKNLDFSQFEKNLKRKIQIFWFKSVNDIKNKELAVNIINGHILSGKLSL